MNAPSSPLHDLLGRARVIPVITIERVEDAVPLAQSLMAGGIDTLEITLRTPIALAAAEAIMADIPEAFVGLGTVLDAADLTRAEAIGARFALSPGATPELLDAAAAADIDFIPGIATASELMAALGRGFDVFKFFPAREAGGVAALRALAGPFPQARFCPTGGIAADSAATWLAEPNVLAVGGSWLCPLADIRARNWSRIEQLARSTVAALSAR